MRPTLAFFFLALASAQQAENATTTTASTQYTDDDAFEEAVLSMTNTYRRQHNATAVVWNETLAEFAEDYGKACEFEHSGGPYGENLVTGYPNVTASILAWGEERTKYDFKKGEFSSATGHFTQLVWRNTTQVGCSRKACNAGQSGGEGDASGWYLICEYWPRGNVIGQFVDNVKARVEEGDMPSATGASNPAVPTGSAAGVGRGMGAVWVGLVVWGVLWWM